MKDILSRPNLHLKTVPQKIIIIIIKEYQYLKRKRMKIFWS